MIPKELAKKIRYIQIRTSKTVTDVLAGEYKSAFRGAGMEFDEVREYQPGDEVRSIDWNVTARQGRPFVKRFHEERELTVVFVVDLSASGQFSSSQGSKNDLAAELCALLSFSAVKSNDKVGLILFTDRIERFIPPGKGISHAMRIIREVLGFTPSGTQTNIPDALDFLGKVIRKRAVVFLISDFLGENFEKPLRQLSRRHDLIAISVSDAREQSLPDVGLLELEDAETGECLLIDTSSASVRQEYAQLAGQQQNGLRSSFRSMGIDQLDIRTDQDYQNALAAFFRRRERLRK
ncbi:MAG: DUF58 domain-containing protein [Lentisphaeria bacterium]